MVRKRPSYSNHKSPTDNTMKYLCTLFAALTLILWATVGVWHILIDKNCLGYLKRAADSNTVERAQLELGKAQDYMVKNGLNRGYTSVLYNTPDEDIEFWYDNISDARYELTKVMANEDATELEKSNVLMKLRETLIDHGNNGEKLTYPAGLAKYPQNTPVAFLQILFITGFLGTGGWKFFKHIK